MLRSTTLLAAALLATIAVAQTSNTLPSGHDTRAGSSAHWPGWDQSRLATLTQPTYVPARTQYLYASSTFPWGRSAKVLNAVSLRRDELAFAGTTAAHAKTLRLFVSSNGLPPTRANLWRFAANEGSDKKLVVGSVTTPRTVSFPATARPASGAAPFDLLIPFDSAQTFLVKQDASALCFDWRVYATDKTTVGFAGTWQADAVSYAHRVDGGAAALATGSVTCLTPAPYEFLPYPYAWPGNDIVQRVDWLRSGKIVVGFAGIPVQPQITLPGSAGGASLPDCKVGVRAFAFSVSVSGKDAFGTTRHDYGHVPNLGAAVGLTLGLQQAVFDSTANALGLGFGRAFTQRIGQGFVAPAGSTIAPAGLALYSYGSRTTRGGGVVDPDKEVEPCCYTTRHVVMRLR